MANENTDRKLKHLFDGGAWNVYDTSVINLGVGAPGPDLLQNCCDIFQKATEHRLQYEKSQLAYLFQYGSSSGPIEARQAIAEYFSKAYNSEMKSEDLIITAGATQGLHFILSTLIDMKGIIFVDEVTYMIALDTMKQFTTLTIVPIRLNDDGVDLDEFERALAANQFISKTKEYWAMYYAIPTYHNPTGILFSEDVCQRLIALARKYDVLIFCDDVYNLLCYDTDANPPKRLFAYDHEHRNVISNGSFSKIIAPGIRLGWLEVPPRVKPILETSGVANSGGCFNNYTAGIAASLFELNFAQQHIALMYKAYKERMLAVCNVLEQELPQCCKWVRPRGGYFIWLSMPREADASDFLQVCLKEEKISFIVGSRFAFNGGAKNCFRIAIAFHSKATLVDAVTRLCAGLKKYLKV